MESDDLELRLATWSASLAYTDLPDSVLSTARNCVVDWMGVAIAGTQTDTYAAIASVVDGLAGAEHGPCTVLGRKEKFSAPKAAWLNAAAGHVLDFDDTSYAGILHPTTVVLPAVLAAAQKVGSRFSDILAALVAGVEVELSLGLSFGNTAYGKGVWTTSALGTIGAALGTARVMGLDPGRTANALGLAANFSAGLRNIHGGSGKPYTCGLAARMGFEAAAAAAAGITCPPGAIFGRYGLARLLVQDAFRTDELDTLGVEYRFCEPGIAFKRYPLCSAAQAAVDAILDLKASMPFQASQLHRIDCTATPLVVECLRYTSPDTIAQAQFSMPFALATAVLAGPPAIEHLALEWINEPRLRSLMDRVVLATDPSLASAAPALHCAEAAHVQVFLPDGRTTGKTVLAAKGMPSNPLSEDDRRQKFLACVSPGLGIARAMAWFDTLALATGGMPADDLLIA